MGEMDEGFEVEPSARSALGVVPANGLKCSIGMYDGKGKSGCVPCDHSVLAYEADTCKLCNDGMQGSPDVFQKYMGWCACRTEINIPGVFPVGKDRLTFLDNFNNCDVEIACLPGQQRPCFPPDKKAWTRFVNATPYFSPFLIASTIFIAYVLYTRRRAQVVPI